MTKGTTKNINNSNDKLVETKIELIETLRKEEATLSKNISHEENLINNRITWMLTMQGFLFAALAIIAKKEIKTIEFPPAIDILQNMIPILGGLIAFFVFFGVYAAYMQIDNHKDVKNTKIKELMKNQNDNYHIIIPSKSPARLASVIGRIVGMSIPASIMLIWVYFYIKVNFYESIIADYIFIVIVLVFVNIILFKANATKNTHINNKDCS